MRRAAWAAEAAFSCAWNWEHAVSSAAEIAPARNLAAPSKLVLLRIGIGRGVLLKDYLSLSSTQLLEYIHTTTHFERERESKLGDEDSLMG